LLPDNVQMPSIKPSRVELRIVSGSLRGRKISAVVHEDLRPRVRGLVDADGLVRGDLERWRTWN
jgi:hypothetical protein